MKHGDLLDLVPADLQDLCTTSPSEERSVKGCLCSPESQLANPTILVDFDGLLKSWAMVLQTPLEHKDELLHRLPIHQCVLARPQCGLCHCLRAELADDVGVKAKVLTEERVLGEPRKVDLFPQLLLEWLWQHPQQLDVLHLDDPLPKGLGVVLPYGPPDTAGELVRDLVAAQEDADLALAGRPRRVDVADVRHGLRDPADEGGEDHKRKDDYNNVEEPLNLVFGEHFHGGWRELCQ
mmetsp:Transcript_74088/g.233985  ORF Transcript_74088/g.233985 Transcript_74088/m.233985 type:complete len:237 (+) Transcript_74088:400-1110(+)